LGLIKTNPEIDSSIMGRHFFRIQVTNDLNRGSVVTIQDIYQPDSQYLILLE